MSDRLDIEYVWLCDGLFGDAPSEDGLRAAYAANPRPRWLRAPWWRQPWPRVLAVLGAVLLAVVFAALFMAAGV